MPFGTSGPAGGDAGQRERAGAWARQIARRLVDRYAGAAELDVRPVILVAMPKADAAAGYLVFGSTPEPKQAVEYGRSLGAAYALVGTYGERGDARRLDASLVDVAGERVTATFERDIAPGELHLVEPALAGWLAGALGIQAERDLASPAAANERAYAALLEAMDAEVDATLFRGSDPGGALHALARAVAAYAAAIRADPSSVTTEERILILGASSIEREEQPVVLPALSALAQARAGSWRAHYLLAEVRRTAGETSSAIVAFEHADALQPLGDRDVLTLARLYAETGATASAVARLRRIGPESELYAEGQELLGFVVGSTGDLDTADAAFERALAAGSGPGTRLTRARLLIAAGRRDRALRELNAILTGAAAAAVAAGARRLRLGLLHPDLERGLEEAGTIALAGDVARLGEAAERLRGALAAEPALWEAHLGMGLVARRAGDPAEAERSFRRALEIYPDQPDILHELGVALVEGGRPDDALQVLARANELRPDDPAFLADEGYARLRTGDVAGARERLRRAQGIDPEDPVTRAYLAELERIEGEAGRPN